MRTAAAEVTSDAPFPRAVEQRGLSSLARTSLRALAIVPPLYIDSVFGHPWTWIP